MLLNAEERDRFASYVERSAESDAQILKATANRPEWAMIAEKKKREMEACIVVAEMLRETKDFTLGGP